MTRDQLNKGIQVLSIIEKLTERRDKVADILTKLEDGEKPRDMMFRMFCGNDPLTIDVNVEQAKKLLHDKVRELIKAIEEREIEFEGL